MALTGIGILDSFSPKRTKAYRLANTYTWCAVVIMLLNALCYGWFGLHAVTVCCLVGAAGLLSSFLFTIRQKVFTAEAIAVLSNNFAILAAVVLYGDRYWSHLYLVLLIVAYMVIFGRSARFFRNVCISITLFLFGISFFSGSGLIGVANPDVHTVGIITRFNLFLVIVSMLLFFYFAVLHNRRAELMLAKIAREAEHERQLKSDFLSVMSHEIRTPLNAILATGHLLDSKGIDGEQAENLKILNTSAKQLLMLVNDILDFTKLEEGKTELHEHGIKLRELLDTSFKMFAMEAASKSLHYDFDFDPRIARIVKADGSRIAQVISNLLANAIKFTPKGQVALKVKLLESVEDVQTVEFSVADTGIGISEEKQQNIFNGFAQAGTEISVRYGGTGLGLAISQKIIHLFQSQIVVESKVGEGSVFRFCLKLRALNCNKNTLETSPGIELQDLSGFRVLLAEDNLVNQTIMRKFFDRWQLDHTIVSDGRMALDALEKSCKMPSEAKAFDLILMDIQMPVMDGVEASLRIRSSDRPYCDVPIVALTADVTRETRDRAEHAGMNAFISKPFIPAELIAVLNEQLHTRLNS